MWGFFFLFVFWSWESNPSPCTELCPCPAFFFFWDRVPESLSYLGWLDLIKLLPKPSRALSLLVCAIVLDEFIFELICIFENILKITCCSLWCVCLSLLQLSLFLSTVVPQIMNLACSGLWWRQSWQCSSPPAGLWVEAECQWMLPPGNRIACE